MRLQLCIVSMCLAMAALPSRSTELGNDDTPDLDIPEVRASNASRFGKSQHGNC